MAGLIFSSNQIPTMSVPKSVADRFLPQATGTQIKVILCLIRFEDMALTVEDIAKQCNIETDDVLTSVDYWVSNGLLIKRGNTLLLSQNVCEQAQTLPKYNAESILEQKENDKNFSFLIDEVQRIIGKSINHNDASIVFAMYDHLGFSSDLILLVMNYCSRIGKTNFRYIEKVALDWYDRGIDSFDKAEALIKSLEKRATTEHRIMSYFGIEGRSLSKKETQYIEKWTDEFGMSLDMIKEAYEKCIDTKGKLSFAYINGILNGWFDNGYKTPSDVEKSDKKPTNDNKSYDSKDIENEIMKRLAGE